jgi:hypothetical protein
MKLVEERFCFADSLYGERPNLIYRLAHEFAGETDVISITQSLKEALLYNTETEAQTVLNTQPEWVKRDFCIRKVCLYYGTLTFNTKLLQQEN